MPFIIFWTSSPTPHCVSRSIFFPWPRFDPPAGSGALSGTAGVNLKAAPPSGLRIFSNWMRWPSPKSYFVNASSILSRVAPSRAVRST